MQSIQPADQSNISLQFGYSPFREQNTLDQNQSCSESLEYLSEVFQYHSQMDQQNDFGIQLQQKFGLSNEQSRFEDNKFQNNFDCSSNQHVQLSVSITPNKEAIQPPLQKNHKDWDLVSFSDVVSPQSQLNMLSNLTTPKTYNLANIIQNQQDKEVILEVSDDQTILDQSLTVSKFQRDLNDDHKLLRAKKLEKLQQTLKSERMKTQKGKENQDRKPEQLSGKVQLTEQKQMLKIVSSKIDNYTIQNFRKISQPSVGVIEVFNSLLQLLNGLCLQVTKFKIIGEIKNWKRLCAILGQSQALLSAINKMDIVIEQNILPEMNVRNSIKFYEESMQYGDQTYRGQEEQKIVFIKQFILKSIEYYYLNLRLRDKQTKKEMRPNLEIQIGSSDYYSHKIDNDNYTMTQKQLIQESNKSQDKKVMKKYQSCSTFKEERDFQEIQDQLKKVQKQRKHLQRQII